MIPRDLRNAVVEVRGHAAQMPQMREALAAVKAPIHLIHGDADDFAPLPVAQSFAETAAAGAPIRFRLVEGANHFLNDGPVETLIGALEECLPAPGASPAPAREALRTFGRFVASGFAPMPRPALGA
jgi:pimeloyl-ACP methyl ester carboxylesterase